MVISGAKRIYDRSGKVSLSTEIKEGDKRKLPFQRYLEEGEYSSKYNYEGKYLTMFLQKMYIGRQNY